MKGQIQLISDILKIFDLLMIEFCVLLNKKKWIGNFSNFSNFSISICCLQKRTSEEIIRLLLINICNSKSKKKVTIFLSFQNSKKVTNFQKKKKSVWCYCIDWHFWINWLIFQLLLVFHLQNGFDFSEKLLFLTNSKFFGFCKINKQLFIEYIYLQQSFKFKFKLILCLFLFFFDQHFSNQIFQFQTNQRYVKLQINSNHHQFSFNSPFFKKSLLRIFTKKL